MRRRRGYSLIELAVTVLIVGMLVVAGIVVGSRVTRQMQSTNTRTLLDSATGAQLSYAGRTGGYATQSAAMGALDGVQVVTGSSSTPGELSMVVGSGGSLVLAMRNADGSCAVRIVGALLDGAARQDFTTNDGCEASAYLPAGEIPVAG